MCYIRHRGKFGPTFVGFFSQLFYLMWLIYGAFGPFRGVLQAVEPGKTILGLVTLYHDPFRLKIDPHVSIITHHHDREAKVDDIFKSGDLFLSLRRR